jgi:hypothetical protein
MKIFENRVLRRIFGLKTDETIGGRRKLLNNELLFTKYNKKDQAKDKIGRSCSLQG